VEGDPTGDVLVVGWGSTYGSIRSAVSAARERGRSVSHAHLRYLSPLPRNLGEVLGQFKRILIPEINNGQLSQLLRSKYLVAAEGFNLIRGLPLGADEIEERIEEMFGGKNA
jgi:2-oxoglutarate ferredoxin oxidoreductase subunit alpha